MPHILAVDDDRDVLALLRQALGRDGHEVRVCASAAEVTEPLCRWADCILLDVMMPGEDGVALCRRIRALTGAPILFLTAKGEEADVLAGLAAGGDDYLSKPFRLAEVRARGGADLRRQARGGGQTRRSRGGVTFDLSARSAAVGEVPLPLTKSEYAICELLALHPGQVFGKEQIYEAVFGYDGDADESAITEHVKNIRAKLRAAGLAESPLATVWGIGYKWKEDRP